MNIGPIILGAVGLIICFIPSKHLIKIDRRTGYWIYKKSLKAHGDELRALRVAGVFYKIFGIVFFLFCLSFFGSVS